jgi:hypothetical protein
VRDDTLQGRPECAHRRALTVACACSRGLSCIDVLVIDDWMMVPLSDHERRDFWESL